MLDTFLVELNRQFNQENVDLMKAIQSFHPASEHFLNHNDMEPLALNYSLDFQLLSMESILAKRTLENIDKQMESVGDVFRELVRLKDAFPTLLKAIHIALTIAVSTAECERSFSALKRIKTYLRSTMTEQRLTDLAILSIEKELANDISLDDVVDLFAARDKNSRIVLK